MLTSFANLTDLLENQLSNKHIHTFSVLLNRCQIKYFHSSHSKKKWIMVQILNNLQSTAFFLFRKTTTSRNSAAYFQFF